ncbi:MAG: hypothetical protein KJN76_14500 [Eudoraea sp.]|nr:hypothetical protein [Eudoraea sp.]
MNSEVSGGGYFYDLAPHQIDLMYHYFGEFDAISGYSSSSGKDTLVEDTVNGIIKFRNGIQFRGLWNFNASEYYKKEECIIYGTLGKLHFSFYGDTVTLSDKKGNTVFSLHNPKDIQQPMIAAVVAYFLGKNENPCPAEDGLLVIQALEKLSGRCGTEQLSL